MRTSLSLDVKFNDMTSGPFFSRRQFETPDQIFYRKSKVSLKYKGCVHEHVAVRCVLQV